MIDGLETHRMPTAAAWRLSYMLVQGLSSVGP
jgi:hypothetical protein